MSTLSINSLLIHLQIHVLKEAVELILILILGGQYLLLGEYSSQFESDRVNTSVDSTVNAITQYDCRG